MLSVTQQAVRNTAVSDSNARLLLLLINELLKLRSNFVTAAYRYGVFENEVPRAELGLIS